MRVLRGAIQAQEVREGLQRQRLFVLGYCVGNYWCCERRGRGSAAKSYAIRIKETRSRAQLVLRAPMGPPVDLPPERGCQDDSCCELVTLTALTLANSHPDLLVTSEELDIDIF